jgi:hypothetical protein
MKAIKSIVLSRFNKNGRIFRRNLKKKCEDLTRAEFEDGIKSLIEKGVIQAIDTMTEDVEYAITLYVCNYDITGSDGDIVFLGRKKYGENCDITDDDI